MNGKDWLNEMLDAALENTPETRSKPDFAAVRHSSETQIRRPFGRTAPFRIMLAAAALILALPGGILLGRRVATVRMLQDDRDLFVQELLGNTIFEEGLEPPETWVSGEFLDDGLFGLSEEA